MEFQERQRPQIIIEQHSDGNMYAHDLEHDTYERVESQPQYHADAYDSQVVTVQPEKPQRDHRLARFAGKAAMAGVGFALLYGGAYVTADAVTKTATFRQDQISFDHIKDDLMKDITDKLAGE